MPFPFDVSEHEQHVNTVPVRLCINVKLCVDRGDGDERGKWRAEQENTNTGDNQHIKTQIIRGYHEWHEDGSRERVGRSLSYCHTVTQHEQLIFITQVITTCSLSLEALIITAAIK